MLLVHFMIYLDCVFFNINKRLRHKRVLSPRLCQLTLVQNLAHTDICLAKVIVFHFRSNARLNYGMG
jgi:hypothetical protein